MSESVKNYPPIVWSLPGLRPLQVGLVLTLVATSIAGILSNPLFTLATDSVVKTPMLQQATVRTQPIAEQSIPKTAELPQSESHG
jgi:NAD(P)H-quinone oxidoreductase subunit 2